MEWPDAVSIAARAHGRRRDRSDILELVHGVSVASALGDDATEDELAAAVLHDVLEDTDWTAGPSPAPASRPWLSTRSSTSPGSRSRRRRPIARSSLARPGPTGEAGRIARHVSFADLLTNMERIRSLPEAEDMRQKRYIPAIETIRRAMRERGELERG